MLSFNCGVFIFQTILDLNNNTTIVPYTTLLLSLLMQIKVCLRCNFFLKLKKCHLTERKTSKAALMNFFSYRNGKIRMFHK